MEIIIEEYGDALLALVASIPVIAMVWKLVEVASVF